MPRIKLTIEYDGTHYVGWQVQPNGPSLQTAVERALESLLGSPVRLESAGRTDSGVHAFGQVVAFTTERTLPLKAYWRGLTGILPEDISVVDAEEVPHDFDPRRWATGKRYRYRIANLRSRSPLRRRTHWEIFSPLDAKAMHEAAQHLLGRHDFSAFRAADCEAKHPFREIREAAVIDEGDGTLRIELEGTAFLKHMVRNIAGTLVKVGQGKCPPEWVAEVLASKDRSRAGMTAPPQGLVLVAVRYDGRTELADE